MHWGTLLIFSLLFTRITVYNGVSHDPLNPLLWQWHSQKILIGEADFAIVCCGDCSIRVTALLGYLDLTGPVF